jgi:hypothetical protein
VLSSIERQIIDIPTVKHWETLRHIPHNCHFPVVDTIEHGLLTHWRLLYVACRVFQGKDINICEIAELTDDFSPSSVISCVGRRAITSKRLRSITMLHIPETTSSRSHVEAMG